MDKAVSETVMQAILDLRKGGRIASREAISSLTGLTKTVVDWHVKNFINDGLLRKVVNGVYEPVEQFAPSRAISKTVLISGIVRLELGDTCEDLTPHEAREIGKLFHVEALEIINIQGERDVHDMVARLRQELGNAQKRIAELGKAMVKMQQQERQPDMFVVGTNTQH